MSTLCISGGTVVALDPPIIERRDVEIGLQPSRRLDASGCLVLPGLVNAHTHLYSGLARGMPFPASPTRSFLEILEQVWWRLDRALDAASLRAAAEVALLDAALAGTTTIVDHHESPSFIDGSLDVLADAARGIGLRVVLAYGATDRHGPTAATAGLAECERLLGTGAPAMVALHAGFTLSDATLERAAALVQSRGAWLHVHVAEDRCDADSFARLDRAGLIGPRTLLAHGVHLTFAERARAAEAGATIVHNPRSNQQNGVGYADPRSFPGRVGLGTDGMDGDLWSELRAAHLQAREAYGPSSTFDALSLLAANGRLADELVGPRPGDWIVLDYDAPTPIDATNFAGHLLFGIGARHVRDVVVGGEIVIENRRPVLVDAARIHARGREEARRLWGRMP